MTAQDRKRAADGLQRLIVRLDRGELDAPKWYRERLEGAIIALRSTA